MKRELNNIMKSAVLEQPEIIKLVDRPVPEINEGEILIKIKYGGICGSDIHAYNGNQPFITYPRVLGHELVGIVEKSKSKEFDKGEKVVVDPVFSCDECYACRVGRHNVCKEVKVFGVHMDGGFQEFAKLPKKNVFKLPSDVSLKFGALAEPFSIGFEANHRAQVEPGDIVTVIGSGTIGLMVALVAKYIGAEVISIDIDDSKLSIARELGIDYVINSKDSSPYNKIMEITDDEGSPVVIEAVGKEGTIKQTLSLVSAAGRVVILGLTDKEIPVSITEIIKKEVDFLGSRLNKNMFPKVVKMLQDDKINFSLLEDYIDIYEIDKVNDAFENTIKHPGKHIKSLIKFD